MTDWENSALCAQADPEVWYPTSGGDNGAAARRTCAACPVQTECLAAAMEAEKGQARQQRHGIRGGLSADQRYDRAKAAEPSEPQ